MSEKSQYFVVKQKAIPEVLLKVVEAKKLLETNAVETIQEAVDQLGISRSSFYKYKDDIFPFHENVQGKTITFVLQMPDDPPEHSHQWNGFYYHQCRCASYHRKRFGDDGDHRE